MSPSCREGVGAGNKKKQDGRKCPRPAARESEQGTKRSKMEENVPTLPPGSKRGEQKEARWKKMSPHCRKGTDAGNKTEQDGRKCPHTATREPARGTKRSKIGGIVPALPQESNNNL